jgi:hypothetical protein
MHGNFRKNILKNKIDINSIDNEINGSDVSIVKSPFDSFPKTKLSNINNEINNKSNEINSLILSTIEPKYKPYVIKRQRRSSINQKQLLNDPFLNRLRNSQLNNGGRLSKTIYNDRISLGALNYFSMKDYGNNNRGLQILDEKKLAILRNSKFFSIEKGSLIPNIHKSNTLNVTLNSEKSIDNHFKNNIKNQNKFRSHLQLNKYKNSLTIDNSISSNKNNENAISKRPESVRNIRTIYVNKNILNNFKRNYFKKVDIVNKNIKNMNKRLFRISDKAEYKKRKEPEIDNVLEIILDKKIKKKKKSGTKQLYIKSAKENDVINNMDKHKRDLIRIGEIVKNMNNDVALKFSENLIEEYHKKTIPLKLGKIPEIIKQKEERQHNSRIIRMYKRDLQVQRMLYHAQEEKLQLYKNFNKVLYNNEKGKKIKE